MRITHLLVISLLTSPLLLAQDHTSPYAGEEQRAIKSLSASDVEQLRRGAGWGFAKAAELNGLPGPAHVLEMAEEIHLTDEQRQAIEALFAQMQAEAISLGERFVELESALDQRFAEGNIDETSLGELVRQIESTRAELRIVHLKTHLKTPEILRPEQIAHYNRLRGYASDDDPCKNVPMGHDPEMWKMHHGCG